MPEKANNPFNFWQELKRRKVIRVITVYAAAAFVILELVDIVAPSLGLPAWTLNFVIVLLCVGFILSIILSWIYDITPEGVKKTKPISRETEHKEEKPAGTTGWKIATGISIVVIIGLVILNVFGGRKKAENLTELEKSIAVLPFENMSDGEEYSWFGDAITDEIIMQLYKINAFDVRSRTSILHYKNSEKGSPIIGQELNVNYLLEGTAQRMGDQVRIRVQLIHASTDNHIWGEVFEGNWKDIMDMQISVAMKVANELKALLSPEELEIIGKKPTENLEAYNAYLLGRYFWNKRTKDDLHKSITFFEQAIEMDPEYALAYTGIADAYIVLGDWGYINPEEAYPKSKQYVKRALEINNDLPEALTSLACITYTYDRNWQDGEKIFKQALEKYQNDPILHEEYGTLLLSMERFDEAFYQIDLALELEPLSIVSNLIKGWLLYVANQYDEAISQYQVTLEFDTSFSDLYYFTSLCYQKEGLFTEAFREYKKGMSMHTESSKYLMKADSIFGKSGINGFYNWLVDEGTFYTRYTYNIPYFKAQYCAALGDHEQAFEWLNKAYEKHVYFLIYLKADPIFDNLHSDPRFNELLKKIGLEE